MQQVDLSPASSVMGQAVGAGPVLVEDAASLLVNERLRSLGPDAATALMAQGRPAALSAGQTLWSPGQAPGMVCFPLSGLIAALAIDHDGAVAQVECVGLEGAVGLIEALAEQPLAFEYRALVATEAWLVPIGAVQGVMQASPPVAKALQRYLARQFDAVRRGSACAARHALRARLADCLLAYQEKTSLTRLPTTQEMLSSVLGANRTTVTALTISLSEAGLTRTGRGWIAIVDPGRLDRLACGCRKASPAPQRPSF